ncbi:unnamed protein product [Dovyalis caffra]|uniref:Uncharacterized protein n=1 Tax=Dovyalis caffra TaxID=77055 RepID=A0AAV1RZI7_9ROSI|nr:unnamed protein product [Dovyalis caffra]
MEKVQVAAAPINLTSSTNARGCMLPSLKKPTYIIPRLLVVIVMENHKVLSSGKKSVGDKLDQVPGRRWRSDPEDIGSES